MEEILHTALLGTAKRALNVSKLALPIQKILQDVPVDDKEDFLLKAAVLSIKYANAGKKAPHLNLKEIPKSPIEIKKIAPQFYSDNFSDLINVFKKTNEPEDLDKFMKRMSEENLIFPPETLVQIFNALSKKLKGYNFINGRHFIEKFQELIGERGWWLLRLNAAWKNLI